MAQRNQANQAQANPAQPPVAATALARPVVVPKPFSAKFEDDWLQWISSFNSACEVNGYGDADRIRFMAALFEGTAQQVFQHVSTTNANATYQQISWQINLSLHNSNRCMRANYSTNQISFRVPDCVCFGASVISPTSFSRPR